MADELHQALDYVGGRIELDLSVLWNEERLFAEIVAENDDIRALRDSLAGQSPEATHYQRVQLGEMIAAAIQRKSDAEAASLLDALEPLAVETRVNDNLSYMMLLNAAFLAEDSSCVEGHDGVRCESSGPWAPYSFAVPAEEEKP